MYCINCGIKLADTEKKCPLCNTVVCHSDLKQQAIRPLYPNNKMPKICSNTKSLSGAIVIIFLIPLIISFLWDIQIDREVDWFGYVAGALLVAYTIFALPLWFRRPNPVIFISCDFVVTALYVLYINLVTGGNWFLSFALPIIGAFGMITCAVVTLLYYLRRGKLYIWGGALVGLGVFILLIEFLLHLTFNLNFIGWSIYPLIVLIVFGCLLIYLAINSSAREIMERKVFF